MKLKPLHKVWVRRKASEKTEINKIKNLVRLINSGSCRTSSQNVMHVTAWMERPPLKAKWLSPMNLARSVTRHPATCDVALRHLPAQNRTREKKDWKRA